MSFTLDAFLRSWPFDPWLLTGLILTAAIFTRGWLSLHRRDRSRWKYVRLLAIFAGLGSLFLALASPIEPWSSLLLQIHMLQHLLLMMVAPPLLWLGWPLFPLLRGVPAPFRIYWLIPLLRSPALRAFASWLTHPTRALILFVATTWIWHIPAAYDLALKFDFVHYLQHLCFLGAGLVFWYPVVCPYPARPRWSRWLLAPYLIIADLENTVLSALLTFSSTVLYSRYEQGPHLGRLTALDDQAAAGVLMWVPGSLAFLGPLFVIGIRLLYPPRPTAARHEPVAVSSRAATTPRAQRIPLRVIAPALETHRPPIARPAVDLLRVPLLGAFLKWRHARMVLQLPLVLLSAALIFDGLRGPQVGSMNLAGVLPWIHWRGIVILGLLALGNVFCMACPFVLPRTLARRLLPGGRDWPRWLRNKWLAVGLLVLFLWAYEAFSLWDSPWLTAWIAIAYFAFAFAVDAWFRGGTFCKYVCPIGQFNFVQSLVSPFEVRVRDPQICAGCHTKNCIRGRDGIPGCELKLAQPRKAGNLDCTTCLDCLHACPHDNIAIAASLPGQQLWSDPQRSGIGRFSRRPDLAALVIVLVFGAFANAAGMTAPVQDFVAQAGGLLGSRSTLLNTTAYFSLTLIAIPLLLSGLAAFSSRLMSKSRASLLSWATRYSFALIPLGFGMWLAHYSFHFLTSYETVVPVTQRFLSSFGWSGMGAPRWSAACCRPVGSWLPKLEMLFLDLGLLLSLYTGYRITFMHSLDLREGLKAFFPWVFLIGLLFAAGIWLIFQPMQMRGTM
jgi:cytochrome c oxidase assembly factor CtaG